MKNLTRGALCALLLITAIAAAPISGSIAGTGSTLAAPISAGDITITFDTNPFATTTLSTLIAAGGSGTMSILPLTLNSTNAFQVTWAGGLQFDAIAPTPLVTGTGPGTYAVFLTGLYSTSVAGYDPTVGMLALTFQEPAVGSNYSFSYSGSTVPEPASLGLAGVALIFLGWRTSNRVR